MSDLHMLTTIDNPFDPFTQYDEWSRFDEDHGYYSAPLLARVTKSSDEISEADQDLALETAIDEIIREDPFGIYTKVSQKSSDNPGDS